MPRALDEEEKRLVCALQELHARGSQPAELLRHLERVGQRGVNLIVLMQWAFGISLAESTIISAWSPDGKGPVDDERLNRYLSARVSNPLVNNRS